MRPLAKVCLFLWSVPCVADSYRRQPALDVLHYEIAVELAEAADTISGITRVHVLVRQDNTTGMWLDFEGMTVERVQLKGRQIDFVHRDGKLSFNFDQPYRQREIAVVEVRYRGKPAAGMLIGRNRHGRRVYFAENWPDRAHHWFPCIDHPSDKATVDFRITVPEKFDVVANGTLVETRSLMDGRRLTRWSEKSPVPTYCMVIGAAEFSIVHAGMAQGIPILYYAYPADAAAAARRFARSNLMLEFFAGRIGPYPYEKLAQVETTTRIGGMENSSAIFYAEALFQGNSGDEAPVAHEIAHQWFGDSVTQADWDHVWLSEGFATYFDALFYEHLEGRDSLKRIMAQAAEAVKGQHKLRPAPVVDAATTDPAKKMNAFTYQKGAWILHMLRKLLGDEAFFKGIRRYYEIFQGKNALSEDFQRVMESIAGTGLATFFRQWLYQPGWPEYHISWEWNPESATTEVTIRQVQTTGLFDMPVDLVIRSGAARSQHSVRVSAESHSFRMPSEERPTSVEIDPDGWLLKSVTVGKN